MEKVLALDIGGTHAKYAFVYENGEIENPDKFQTDSTISLESFENKLLSLVEIAVNQGVSKIGIACAGSFDKTGLCLGNVENLPFLKGLNLCEIINKKYPDVKITLQNDANAAALGEYFLGAGQKSPSFLCITLGTGIGGAYVLDGKPLLGHRFQALEVGYFNYIDQDNFMEKFYSTKGILKKMRKELGINRVGGKTFTDKVEAGNPIYVEYFNDWIDNLGKMLANLCLILDPERIIVGGGISREEKLLTPSLTFAMNKYLPENFKDKIPIFMAKCGNNAGLLGSAFSCFND